MTKEQLEEEAWNIWVREVNKDIMESIWAYKDLPDRYKISWKKVVEFIIQEGSNK